jgi:hypothetical protein
MLKLKNFRFVMTFVVAIAIAALISNCGSKDSAPSQSNETLHKPIEISRLLKMISQSRDATDAVNSIQRGTPSLLMARADFRTNTNTSKNSTLIHLQIQYWTTPSDAPDLEKAGLKTFVGFTGERLYDESEIEDGLGFAPHVLSSCLSKDCSAILLKVGSYKDKDDKTYTVLVLDSHGGIVYSVSRPDEHGAADRR